jgi:hypothetical protein
MLLSGAAASLPAAAGFGSAVKHGIKLSPDRRRAMAREAVAIFEACGSRARALEAIEDRFDVSTPTARNLLNYGRWLDREDKA